MLSLLFFLSSQFVSLSWSLKYFYSKGVRTPLSETTLTCIEWSLIRTILIFSLPGNLLPTSARQHRHPSHRVPNPRPLSRRRHLWLPRLRVQGSVVIDWKADPKAAPDLLPGRRPNPDHQGWRIPGGPLHHGEPELGLD